MKAPIILFTYNRASTTLATLKSLEINVEIKDSVLYIFCDGPKVNANAEDIRKIKAVKSVIESKK